MIWHDLATVGTLVLIEGLLSADNALVLAILVRHLPGPERKKALRYGIWGAFVCQFVCILFATWLIKLWYFKVGGAAYLLYIAISHLIRHDPEHTVEAKAVSRAGFWKTVAIVELTDLAFSIDSILAAVAMSDKLWVVYLGGAIAIVTMRFVAGKFLHLLDRFPALSIGAYLLVIWIGLKLLIDGWSMVVHEYGAAWGWSAEQMATYSFHMSHGLFWLGMASIFFGSLLWPKRRKKPHHAHAKAHQHQN